MDVKDIKHGSIVFTTIDLINENGIQAVSTREVAKRQGISHGTVFQHFPKKNDLINAVLDQYSLYDSDIFNSTRLKSMQPKEAIVFYVDSYVSYYENYPAITAVAQAFDILRDDPELGSKVRSIYSNRNQYIKVLIEEAQLNGIIYKEVDSEILADIISAACYGICLKWRINNFNFSLRERTLKAVDMILDAFSPLK